MVEFEYQPWKKIVVHEIVEYPLEYFINKHSIRAQEGGTGAPLNWANGIVFEHSTIRPIDDVIKEQIKGTIHWSYLHYAFMLDFKKELEGPRAVKIPIVNLSNHYIFSSMSKWIKETREKSENQNK